SHRSFLDAQDQADLDPIIVPEGDARSSFDTEPQPPRYTIFGEESRVAADGERQIEMMRSGMPCPPQYGGAPISNIRNTGARIGDARAAHE
ncbi:MAG: hypothetical protein ACLP4V_19415, partial [Methylocella sp.]